MTPQTSKEELVLFISVYKMDPVTEYDGQVLLFEASIEKK